MTKLNEYVKVAFAAETLGISQNMASVWSETSEIACKPKPDQCLSSLSEI